MKHLIKLGFKNIFRNPRRTFLTVTAVFFATFLVVVFKSIIGGLWGNSINNVVMLETGHVKVAHEKYMKKKKTRPLEYYIKNTAEYTRKLRGLKNVNLVTPRIKAPVMLNKNDKNYYAQVMGINPEKEKKFNVIHEKMVKGEYLSSTSDEIIVGSGFAEKFDLEVGQKITLLSTTVFNSISVESFRVIGIFTYGIKSLDDRLMITSISNAQEMVKMEDGVSELLLILEDREKAIGVEKEAGKILPPYYKATAWQNQESLFSFLQIARKMYNGIYFFFLLLASFVIINTIMISVYEREREIGALSALGMTNGEILGTFITEAGILSFMGSILGSLTGGLVSYIFSKVGINTVETFGESLSEMNISNVIYLRPEWGTILFSFIFGFLVCIIFASIPAFKAVRMDPIKALRAI